MGSLLTLTLRTGAHHLLQRAASVTVQANPQVMRHARNAMVTVITATGSSASEVSLDHGRTCKICHGWARERHGAPFGKVAVFSSTELAHTVEGPGARGCRDRRPDAMIVWNSLHRA